MMRAAAAFLTLMLSALAGGCLNPDFVSTNLGGLYPSAPGDEPFLLVRVVNDTTATLDIPISFEDGTNSLPFTITDLTPAGREVGVLLDWPVTRVAVGDLENPFLPSVVASLPNGINVVIPPNQYALRAGVDYNRGDAIVYRFVADARNPAAIGVTIAKIDGSTQQGPFTRADTFRTVRQLLQWSEAITGAATP
ncbi:MAG: hypothetical protein AMXMBFR83_17650 [Phycisphaerae bacterium]